MTGRVEDFNGALQTFFEGHQNVMEYLRTAGIDFTALSPDQIREIYRGLTAENVSTASSRGTTLGSSLAWKSGIGPRVMREAWNISQDPSRRNTPFGSDPAASGLDPHAFGGDEPTTPASDPEY